jgi:pectate lyase
MRPLARLAALALLAMAAPVHAANCSAAVVNGGLYSVANMASGKVLDITAGAPQAGAYVQQWGHGGSANQQFTLRDLGNGYWSMTARHSGMPLGVRELSMADGARVVQWPAKRQRFAHLSGDRRRQRLPALVL